MQNQSVPAQRPANSVSAQSTPLVCPLLGSTNPTSHNHLYFQFTFANGTSPIGTQTIRLTGCKPIRCSSESPYFYLCFWISCFNRRDSIGEFFSTAVAVAGHFLHELDDPAVVASPLLASIPTPVGDELGVRGDR